MRPVRYDEVIVRVAWKVLLALVAAIGCNGQREDDAAACDAPGTICTLAGTGEAALGPDAVDPAASALYLPQDVAEGPDGLVYIVDWNNHRARRIDEDGLIRSVAGTGELADRVAPGEAASTALFHPTDVAFGDGGVMYVAVWHSNVIAAIELSSGELTLVCGSGELTVLGPRASQACTGQDCAAEDATGFAGDGAGAHDARLALPFAGMSVPAGGIAFAPDGTLYLADRDNHRVRALSPQGVVSTVAGSGRPGTDADANERGDGGPATEARIDAPGDVAVGPDGTLYIADTGGSCVRHVAADGTIDTVAGTCGERGDAGDGGAANNATLDRPYGIAVGGDGRLYIADTHNHRVRVVAPR